MLKVTFCTYDKPNTVGGPGAWLTRLLPALAERGIEVRCLALVHCGDSGPTAEELEKRGIRCSTVRCPDYLEDQIAWILHQLHDDPPDVFVPNLVLAGLFAARWLKPANIPSIGVIHSDDAYYHGVINDFVLGSRKFRLSGVVCVSKELENQITRRRPDDILIRTIPCGVPIPSASARRVPGRLRLAYVGRLVEEQKKVSLLTRAFCKACEQVEGVEAVLAGDGPDKAAVESILSEGCADSSVRLLGRVEVGEVQRLLLSNDVIVLLSDYEGLPVALMEGMACGCVPVVLRTRSGIPELVDDGATGLVVDDRDASFIRTIRRLRDDVVLWERLSVAAKRRITESYSESASNARWEQLLRGLAEKSGARGQLQIPRRILLPDGDPGLEIPQRRKPQVPASIALYRQLRTRAGRIRRTIFGQKTDEPQ